MYKSTGACARGVFLMVLTQFEMMELALDQIVVYDDWYEFT